jgi:hypothetical protein
MKFMVLVKANAETEAGVMPSEAMLSEMTAFNEQLVAAGIMKAGEGLHPSSKGARVVFSRNGTSVIDGPFPETKELIAGFWIWECGSLAEAIEWAKRCPFSPDEQESDSCLELRQIFTDEDFGDALTPELREREAKMRAATGSE